MINIIISGFILGMTLAVLVGPAFFTLLQTSVNHGFRIGMFLAIGIFLSDLTLVSLSFLGASQVISGEKYRIIFGITGGLILIAYGAYTFMKKVVNYSDNSNNIVTRENKLEARENEIIGKIHAPQPVLYMIKGYFLNLINPFLLIFWVGVMSFVTAEYNGKTIDILVFFGVALATVLATDFLKCFVANQIKKLLSHRILSFLNHALGILLIGFGMYLIIKTLVLFCF
jgi:threonine/homoserine/homoserine lactone efflux protein